MSQGLLRIAKRQLVLRTCNTPASKGIKSRTACRAPVRMQLDLIRWDKQKGPVTRKKVLQQLESEGFSTSVYTFPAGTVFGDHSHGCDKKDSIISGRFLFRMEGKEVILEAGDMLVVPRGKSHYAEVVGNTPCEFVDASKY